MMSECKHVLFIHGFNSSPLSVKAQKTQRYLARFFPEIKFHCPQLATTPNQAIRQLELIIKKNSLNNSSQWYLIGSSLGGYFATYLSEIYQLPAVLINPAIKPYQHLEEYLGKQVNPYTGEVYNIESRYINDLKILVQEKIVKKNYLVMVQTGDEVLDYQQAVEKYKNCRLIVQQGGDHSFTDYQVMLPKITSFFNFHLAKAEI